MHKAIGWVSTREITGARGALTGARKRPMIIHDSAKFKPGTWQLHGASALAIGACIALQLLWGFSTAALVFIIVFAGAGVACLFLKRRKRSEDDYKAVQIDESGLVGVTYAGKRLDFGWSEMSLVKFGDAQSAKKGSIEIQGRGLRGVIREDIFAQFAQIRDALHKSCDAKRVKYEEQSLEPEEAQKSAVRAARTIIWDKASFDPRVVFRFAMYGAYGVLLVVMLSTWGELAGWVVLTVIWALLSAAWIYVPQLLPSGWLKIIHVTHAGFEGVTFTGKRTEILWQEVKSVRIRFPQGTGQGARAGRIEVNAGDKHLTIGLHFPRFGSIAVQVAKACGEKGVKLSTEGSLRIQTDFTASMSELSAQMDKSSIETDDSAEPGPEES